MPREADRLTALSAFTGLGGLDLGLEAAGFHHVGCIEKDDTARRSLKQNRGESWPLLEPGDISVLARTLTPGQLGLKQGELSVLAGGPPCQPFSKAAQWSASARTGLEDVRSHCLRDFLHLVEIFLPHVVLIENVAGFVQGPVSALVEIERALKGINQRQGTQYSAGRRIVDAADYGVPQNRQRAIIIMSREGQEPTWPRASHADNPICAWDAIGRIEVPNAPKAVGKWADLLPSIPEGENYLWHTRNGGGRPLFGYRTRFWSFLLKLAKDQPSWTLPAQPGPSTGPFHWDNRPLVIPELLRLQSFRADWVVEGAHREQVRQVGNATPPRLAEAVSRAIASTYFGASFKGQRLRHHIPRAESIPKPTPTRPVPAEYVNLVGKHADHPGAGKGPSPRSRADELALKGTS
ncbi:MAG TPA: DNA cytosine methyltransferase [Acidimicrobiales bacterium]|nr:DNA cytosine methyltransferase [Acidimicrobiales bacterium]